MNSNHPSFSNTVGERVRNVGRRAKNVGSDVVSGVADVGQGVIDIGSFVVTEATEAGKGVFKHVGDKFSGLASSRSQSAGAKKQRAPRSLKNYRVGDKVYVGNKIYIVGLRQNKKVLYPYSNKVELAMKLRILEHKGTAADKRRVAQALAALFMANSL